MEIQRTDGKGVGFGSDLLLFYDGYWCIGYSSSRYDYEKDKRIDCWNIDGEMVGFCEVEFYCELPPRPIE